MIYTIPLSLDDAVNLASHLRGEVVDSRPKLAMLIMNAIKDFEEGQAVELKFIMIPE